MRCQVWPTWRVGLLLQGRRRRFLLVPALVVLLGAALVLPSAFVPAAAVHAPSGMQQLPTTTIDIFALADTLAIPLIVTTQGDVVGWSWDVDVDLRVGVEDPVFLTALLFQYRVIHTDTFFFGAPELGVEAMQEGTTIEVVPYVETGRFGITLLATFSETLPPGTHWVLLTVPDSYSLRAHVTLAYDVGAMTFGTDVVDDNDGKLFHLSDFDAGVAVDAGSLLTETSAALGAKRYLSPGERMVYFAFLSPATGHWLYQDDFDGQVRTRDGPSVGVPGTTSVRPTLTAVTTAPATVQMQAALGIQAFEHPFRFITVDLDI